MDGSGVARVDVDEAEEQDDVGDGVLDSLVEVAGVAGMLYRNLNQYMCLPWNSTSTEKKKDNVTHREPCD